MPQWFLKPENALKRAQELLEVGKEQDALDALHDVIKSRKHRLWTKVHEQIMRKHLELCVELRKAHTAKDGLWQYRNMVQQINVKSLEDVVEFYLALAEQKAEEARLKSQGMVEVIADDLDQAESPESLLLSAVSGADAQDRADRTVLSPWLRFLWESYRQCLELLRNNAQVEHLYHKIARQALEFCKKFQRRAEFRKLCDNMRQHLNQLQKAQTAAWSVKLTNPDTIALMQETRLFQLDVAIQMELWQEAYKSTEDVHNMVQWTNRDKEKKLLKPQAVANYYEKLALVFWKAGNKLFHAAALLRLFQHYRDMKKTFGAEEATHQASRVLLATLCIPSGAGVPSTLARHLDMEDTATENQRRLANLLELKSPPSRRSLLRELQRLNVVGLACAPAQELYKWLETEFSPLRLASMIEGQLKNVVNLGKEDYKHYVVALRLVAAEKILTQVAQIYDTITFAGLKKILPFYEMADLERLVVGAAKKAQLHVRVDHRQGCLEFKTLKGPASTGTEDDNAVVGDMQQLQQFYTALKEASGLLEKTTRKQAMMKQLEHHMTVCSYHKLDDYSRILERRRRIEAYKETSERQRFERERAEEEAQARKERERQQLEQARLEAEAKEYVTARKKEAADDLRKKMVHDKIEKLKGTRIGQMVIAQLDDDDLEDLNTEELIKKQVAQMEKERRDQQAKMVQQEKKWDYWVRALHLEEIKERQKEYEEWRVRDKDEWDRFEVERVEKAEKEHQHNVETYNRLERISKDATEFLETVRVARSGEMADRLKAWEQRLKDEKAKRLAERAKQRKDEKKQEYLKQKEEEERRKKEEEESKKRDERPGGKRPYGARTGEGDGPMGRDRMGSRGDQDRPGRREGEDGADTDDWRKVARPITQPGGERGARQGGERRYPGGGPPPSEGAWQRGAAPVDDEPRRQPRMAEGPERPGRGPPNLPEDEGRAPAADWRAEMRPIGPPSSGPGRFEQEGEEGGPPRRGPYPPRDDQEGGGGYGRNRPPPHGGERGGMERREPRWTGRDREEGGPADAAPNWRRGEGVEEPAQDRQIQRGPPSAGRRGGHPDAAVPPGEGGASWRDRGAQPPPPPREAEGGAWRDRGAQPPPSREPEGGAWRDRGGQAPPPPRDTEGGGGGGWRDRGGQAPAPREAEGGAWRDRGGQTPQRDAEGGGAGWRDRGGQAPPPRDTEGGGGGGWRDRGAAAPREAEGGAWRGGDRSHGGGHNRSSDRPPREEGGHEGPPREGGGHYTPRGDRHGQGYGGGRGGGRAGHGGAPQERRNQTQPDTNQNWRQHESK